MEALLVDLINEYRTSKLSHVLSLIPAGFSQSSLKLLKKLWTAANMSQKFEISLLYINVLTTFKQPEQVPLLISLANDCFFVSESLRGSLEADIIEHHAFKTVARLRAKGLLSDSQRLSIDQLFLKYQNDSIQAKLHEIAERIIEGDHSAMQDLTNVFCSFNSTRKLFNCLENDFWEVVSSFKTVRSLHIFVQILNFLNTFVMDAVYVIDQEEYQASYLKYYQVHSKAFKVLWQIVLDISKADIAVSQNLIKVLPKFWNVFVDHRNEMLPDVVLILKQILNAQYVDSLNLAQRFLFDVFTDCKVDPGMKSYLKSEVMQLFIDKGFSFHLKLSNSSETYKINHGFPLFSVVEAGEKFRLKVFVRPQSYLYCAFVLDSHDIDFSLTFYSQKDEEELLYKEKYVSTTVPCEKRVFFEYKGTVVIEWDNSFSWFNSKSIRYRILVLDPVSPQKSTNADFKELKKPEKSGSDANDEVFGILDEHHLTLFSKDKQVDHFSLENPVRTIIEYMSKNKKEALSLITSTDFHSFDTLCLVDLVWAVDLEAAGKFAWKVLNEEYLVIASNIPVPRFSILLNGRVVRSKLNEGKAASKFDEMIVEVLEVFKGKIVFFRVDGKNEWLQVLANRGIQVSGLEVDVETLAVELRSILN